MNVWRIMVVGIDDEPSLAEPRYCRHHSPLIVYFVFPWQPSSVIGYLYHILYKQYVKGHIGVVWINLAFPPHGIEYHYAASEIWTPQVLPPH